MNDPPRSALDAFSPPARGWFRDTFDAPTPVQERGWRHIAAGRHALLVAPTGSGKTLAAFLWGIDRVLRDGAAGAAPAGVQVLYVSPLKALVHDVERNLRAPLVGIRMRAERDGLAPPAVGVDVRTGDTPQRERQRQAKSPAPVLVTTPESLFLLLGAKARAGLASVHTVIVDEIHALAPSKRGVHLALTLERLAELTGADPQRIGLSATVRPHERVARFLGGDREVTVVDAGEAPRLDLTVSVPVADMSAAAAAPPERSGAILGELYAREVGTPAAERGIWPAIHPALLAEIRAHRSTIVFVNSRALSERLAQRLNELAGEDLVRAHHGSVSHEQRAAIEEALKAGSLRAIVATSSLELGIDMGAVDRVIMVESPGSVARGLQRLGRAGHQVGAVSAGSVYPKYRGDLLECAVIAKGMLAGAIEAVRPPANALDVLAQQVVAMCCDAPRSPSALHALVTRADPYRELPLDALLGVLDMLSGKYPSAELADLRPLLSWDRAEDCLSPRRGAPMVARMNAGTIPDRGNYPVHLGEGGPRVGELDEEMVFEARAGENVMLGASTWRIEAIGNDRVLVSPAPGEPGKLPFWRGDGPGRPAELGEALGAFVREVGAMEEGEAAAHLEAALPLDAYAARNLAAYVHEQRRHTGTLPTDRAITVERFRDELGDWRVCILTPFGARIHAPWAMALQRELELRSGFEVQVMYTDDGIVLRFADADDPPPLALLLPDPDRLGELLTEQLADTAMFAGLFRENAVRALLLTRRNPRSRTPLWAQRQRARALLATVRRYPAFPVVLETYRQAMSDQFDLAGLERLLARIRAREVQVHDVQTPSASPFARSLVFAYVAAYIYEQDAPLAERKAQALTLDRALLAELLGHSELRELIDADVLAEVERDLARLAPRRHAADADALHDLLRRLGDLSRDEAAARSADDPDAWLARLERERRAAQVKVGGEARWIAVEDAALYRDALGVLPPAGLPDRLLAPVDGALAALAARYARTHGPFETRAFADRYALSPARAEEVLAGLERAGTVLRGEIRPGGSAPEWCDAQILRRLKRATLAKLRNQVAAVDGATFARFLPGWHGLDGARGGADALEHAIAQLEGLALPWSALAGHVLPARVPGFHPDMLDMLAATGRIVWVGRGALGPGDGRIVLYRRRNAPRLLPPQPPPAPDGPLHRAILAHLETRGASFTMELQDAARAAAAGAGAREVDEALWDLVWAGVVTNDTFQPLRTLGAGPSRRGRGSGLAGGRWSRVAPLHDAALEPTERLLATAECLLERYGVVSREAVASEGLAGGFAPLYKVLRAMEEAGRVRRGYFIEGLGSAQFGHPGAVDRLRAARGDEDPPDPDREPAVRALAALDPANPWGAVLAWPATGGGDRVRPRRVPGAWLLLADGAPALYVAASGRHLLTFPGAAAQPDRALHAALAALPGLPRGARRGLLVIEKVDGEAVADSPHAAALAAHGFVRDYRGMTLAPERGGPPRRPRGTAGAARAGG